MGAPRRASNKGFHTPANQSAGILDDHAVRKNTATREGTVEKVPVNDSDIANKKYVDGKSSQPTQETRAGSECTGADGATDRILTLQNTELTTDPITVYVDGTYISAGDITISHLAANSTIDFDTLNIFDAQEIIVIYGAASNPYMVLKNLDTETGTITGAPANNADIVNKEYVDGETITYTADLRDNSMADTLHRHSELSASDGTPDQALKVDAAGKVGIGITTPAAKLEVAGGALVNYAAQFTTGQNFGVNIISSSHSGSRWLLRSQYDTNTDAFCVRADGNVGVGIAAPDAKLQVVGNTKLGDDNTPPNHMEVSATGDVTFKGTSGLAFAEIYAADVATEITIAGTGKANKVQITAFAVDGVSNNTTPDHTNDHITIVKAGMYMCNVSMHVKTPAGGSSHVVGYSVWKNNGTVGGEFPNLHGQRQLASGGTDEGSISLSGIIDLAVNDTIEVWVWDLTGTDNIVIDDINLSLVQIGGT